MSFLENKNKITKDYRTRNYASIVYEESAPHGWIEALKNQFIPAFVSPLHNRDVNPTGEVKKSHWHVILMFDSVKTTKQAQCVFDKIKGVGCEKVQSIRGYVRYLCHLDNPEKAQYDPTEVVSFCGADYYDIIHLVTDKYKALKEIQEFCINFNYYSFSDLMDYCLVYRPDWFRVVVDNTVYIKEYLKSKSWTFEYKKGSES
jgi:hypothetical protein